MGGWEWHTGRITTTSRGDALKRLDIKPLSVNECWQGKRFKTKKYKQYEKDCLLILPYLEVPEGELIVKYTFGFSSILSDWDNPIKPFQDILQKKYNFDDKYIVKAIVEKVKVKKGKEFIEFSILPVDS